MTLLHSLVIQNTNLLYRVFHCFTHLNFPLRHQPSDLFPADSKHMFIYCFLFVPPSLSSCSEHCLARSYELCESGLSQLIYFSKITSINLTILDTKKSNLYSVVIVRNKTFSRLKRNLNMNIFIFTPFLLTNHISAWILLFIMLCMCQVCICTTTKCGRCMCGRWLVLSSSLIAPPAEG